jgi:hypothetical protein
VGAGVQQHRDDPKATSSGDRVVQAAEGVDVDAMLEEPAQAGGVLEVQLAEDQRFEAGLVEQVKERGVRLFAGVIEGVLVLGGTTLDSSLAQVRTSAGGPIDRRSNTSSGASPSTVTVAAVGSACRSLASARLSASTSARSMPSRLLDCT